MTLSIQETEEKKDRRKGSVKTGAENEVKLPWAEEHLGHQKLEKARKD